MLGKSPNLTQLHTRRSVTYSSGMRPPKPLRASDRARQRLREELDARDIGQQTLADALTKLTGETWTKSKVNHVLNGRVQLLIDDADAIATICKLYLTEVVRDRGLEFYAEMTPTELRILDSLRKKPHVLRGILMLLQLDPAVELGPALPKKGTPGRPLKSRTDKVGV